MDQATSSQKTTSPKTTSLPRDDGEVPGDAAPGLDALACYRALTARDARFDGRFFVGVTSTGIYCRPICPAPSAKFDNCRFYRTAAAAREAGFRPCLRCRPETAPDSGGPGIGIREIGGTGIGAWGGTSNTVRRGLALIAEGALDDEHHGVERLATRLGIGERQLRRLFQAHLGASPIAVAQTRRLHLAKQLIHETRLTMAEIAMAAGFGSVRRFNETFQALYRRPPSALRRKGQTALPAGSAAASGVVVRLPYRPPYDWPFMLSYLAARAIPGIELVQGERYLRSVEIDGTFGSIEIAHDGAKNCLVATIRFPGVKALPTLIARIKRVFDLGADVALIGQHLALDPLLAPLVAARPGLRAPGGWDGFELAIRAILGQQVTVTAGRQLAARLAAICGTELPPSARAVAGITRLFPNAAQVAGADLTGLGMPGARKQTLVAVAVAASADPDLFRAAADIDATIARLRAIKGIGDWTAHYIALRVAREPDAFPASDIGILRGATPPGGVRPTPQALLHMAQAWRPWRAYAAQHLWAADEALFMGRKHG